jgi:DtxR family Mn-dependent transcriptional regulator
MPIRPGQTRPGGASQYSANMEDYLEAIRTLEARHTPVTVTQLSDALGVSKPSVTAAINRLAGEGLVNHEKYGAVELTVRGKAVAEDVSRRHEALHTFLTESLGVSQETAQEDACKLEHHLSHDSSMRLTRFVAYVLQDTQGRPKWLEQFAESISRRPASRGTRTRAAGPISRR